jgi:dimethylaniline monooxygenase (N-oxide forming)
MAGERICVVGAGTSGLAMCRELKRRGVAFDCFERGSEVGGNWRIDNDSGAAAAYESLHTNVSRRRMQYPSTPMPRSFGDFVSHQDMARYLAGYADEHDLRGHIHLGAAVASAAQRSDGGWLVTVRSGDGGETTAAYTALVVATGKDAHPKVPAIPGRFEGRTLHSQSYRRPDSFSGERVLVIGASNSGCDVASEVSSVAASTDMAIRRGTHVLPRYLFGRPVDAGNGPWANRLPWRLQQRTFERMLRISRGRYSRWGWPEPDHPVLGDTPAVSATILAAVARGAVRLRSEPVAFEGRSVRFRDGEVIEYDTLVFATGYRLDFPFFDEQVAARLEIDGNTIPLYRHIVPPKVADLYFIGIVDPHAGHPPVVEPQATWIADVLQGRLAIPAGTLDPPQRRVVQRFVNLRPNSLLIDRFGYPRLLAADRRRGTATTSRAQRCHRGAQPAGRGN